MKKSASEDYVLSASAQPKHWAIRGDGARVKPKQPRPNKIEASPKSGQGGVVYSMGPSAKTHSKAVKLSAGVRQCLHQSIVS